MPDRLDRDRSYPQSHRCGSARSWPPRGTGCSIGSPQQTVGAAEMVIERRRFHFRDIADRPRREMRLALLLDELQSRRHQCRFRIHEACIAPLY